MAKKPIRESAESIWSKPPSERQTKALDDIAKRQREGDDSGIDYSDIPELTDAQLAEFKRPAKKLYASRHGIGWSRI